MSASAFPEGAAPKAPGQRSGRLKVVVTDPPRADVGEVDALAKFGVATVHEAIGRTGFLGTGLRPIQDGARTGGTAVTALCWPGDNLMIHAAVEQCRPGDLLVVTTTSPCTDGLFGELLATSLASRGVRGLVTTTGVRDVADLREMGFPVWSAAVSAQGTVKATAGSVNVPVVLGGQIIRPGDVIVADDDGVVCVPRGQAGRAVKAAEARTAKEDAARAAFAEGRLGLDRYGLRETLVRLGVQYQPYEEYARDGAVS
jgi:4-hydroxy-4-methyl-2-oxoglutarate aldolase